MSRRLKPTLVDYVVIAINPVLIMGLVGSLIYFLLEVLYGGAYPDRLQFCLTMFIFAIVLISRIAMEDGFERAAPFGIAIAVLVGIAMNRFVVYQSTAAASFGWVINWGLMALTWWCAHKLTWDCTTLDDSEDPSGRGLLETAGIEKSSDEPADRSPPAALEPAKALPENLPPPGELSQKRWQQLLDRPRRPHTPGVWVVYFSLASLPIFGLGQRFIPAANTASRRYVFLLLCVYVGCGLSLLLTTSFLSLRRYLRGRRLEMPAAMAGNWLAIGGVMVVGLLLFSALLPRPSPEYAISALPKLVGSDEHDASPISAGSEGVRDPDAGSDSGVDHSPPPPSGEPSPPPGEPDPSGGADARSPSTGPGGQTPGKSGSPASDTGPQSSAGKSGTKSDEKSSASSSDSHPDEKQPGDQPAGEPAQNGSPEKSDNPADSQPEAKSQPQGTPPAGERSANPALQSTDSPPADKPPAQQSPPAEQGQPAHQPSAGSPPPPPPPTPQAPPLPDASLIFSSLAGLLKLALYAALIAGVAYSAWRWRAELREIIAGWLAALRDFWRTFFGGQREIGRSADEIAFNQQQLLWSFSDFVDPFASGRAANSSPAELVKYTFAALEVWGREQGFPRGPDETPHEFVAVLGGAHPRVRADALALANLYSRAVYSQDFLSSAAASNLAQLWRLMQSARPQRSAIPE